MKITLNANDIARELLKDDNAKWSHAAAHALGEYLHDLDESSGTETELDVVAIRCDWSEYASAEAVAEEYKLDTEHARDPVAEVEALLSDRTQWLPLDNGGYLVQQF